MRDEDVAADLDRAAAWVLFVCDERRQEARLAKMMQGMAGAMFGGPSDDPFVEHVGAN